MRAKAIAASAALTLLLTNLLSAAPATLHEGDPAPKLSPSKWLQGEPVKTFEPGTAYLVYFWAAWWMPCKETLAQVERLHQKYQNKGLVVIGQNVKRTEETDIAPFLKRVGPLMSYRVAVDEGATNRSSGRMLESWLYASKAGIPAAFIIDKQGTISFIGHPDEIDDAVLDEVLAGKFDLNKRELARKEAAVKADAWDKHNEAGRLAWQAKDWDKAMREIDELEKLFPHKRAVTECLRMSVFIRKGDLQAANNLALQCSKENPNDPFLQHRVARTIATQARAKYRLPGAERDLLLEGAKNNVVIQTADLLVNRAITMLNGPEPEFLHTQAQLAFLQGKRDKAIQLSTEALALTEPGINDQFAEALEHFKNGRLPQ